jgi:hypothetical protein
MPLRSFGRAEPPHAGTVRIAKHPREAPQLPIVKGLRLRRAHLQGQLAANATVHVVVAPRQILTQQSERIIPISRQIAVVM